MSPAASSAGFSSMWSQWIRGSRRNQVIWRLANFLMALDAYIVTTGVLPSFLHGRDIVAVPLDVDEPMTVGTVRHADRRLSELGHAFMTSLAETAGKMGLAEVK